MSSNFLSILAAAIALLVAAAPARPAGPLDPARPEDALLLNRKMNCSLEDGLPVIHWWKGTMMSRVPGERDRVLFNVQGMNIRQCGSFSDPKRGPGFRSVSREVMLYLDPQTNAVLERWKNPWTGEEVEVIHVANDPVNMRTPTFAYGADGKLLVMHTNGELRLVKLDRGGYHELGTTNLLSGTTRALPALSQGRLYIRNDRTLACFSLAK